MASADIQMTEVHRVILRRARICLLENLDMQILDHLIAKLIVNAEDEDIINATNIRRDKIKQLMDLLPRRGDRAYRVFMDILDEKQNFLYLEIKKIEGEEITNANTAGSATQRFEPMFGPSSAASNHSSATTDPLVRDHAQTRGINAQATDSINCKEEDFKHGFVKTEPMATSSHFCHEITGPDVGQIIDPKRTTPRHPNKQVEQQCLSKLASSLGGEWEALAISMGFKNNQLYHWKEDSKNNVWGQVFAFLIGWKNSKGSSATVGRLIAEISAFGGVDNDSYRFLFFE